MVTAKQIAVSVVDFARENPVTTAAIGTAVVGTGVVVGIAATRRKKRTKRGISRDRKFVSKQKHERRYKRKTKGKKYKTKKSKSRKRRGKVYYAKKTGQPYILKANGQAKFIKGKRRKR